MSAKGNIAGFASIVELLRCPRTGAPLWHDQAASELTSEAEPRTRYKIVRGLPVLIDFSQSAIPESDTLHSPVARRQVPRWMRRIINGRSKVTERNCKAFLSKVKARFPSPTILVVGGGTIGDGAEALYADSSLRLIALDVYASEHLSILADAHQIPLAHESVDAIWVQAVLEHVLDPRAVVGELARVLRTGGIIYAETPFMQMVHEGPYDFSRFTEIGHRFLFRRLSVLDSGVVAGPATVLRWAIRYFFSGLFRSRLAGSIAWVATFWLRFFDCLIPREHASDGASCVYLMGEKTSTSLRIDTVASEYHGAQ